MLDTAPSGAVATNRLLSAISFEDLQRLAPRLRRVTVRAGQILQRRSEKAEGVYFLNSGLCSITRETDDGHQIEVASVGNEGLIGIAAVYVGAEAAGAAATATMLIGGEAHWIAIESFRREISRHDSVASVTGRYLDTFISDLMTSVACHALHPLDQRLAKWLLQAQDRIGGATVPLTHDVLAAVLGVRRASITLAATSLHQHGIVSDGHRRIRVADRPALEAVACDCYASVQTSMTRLFAR